MKRITTFLCLVTALTAAAQTENIDTAVFSRIRAAEMTSSQIPMIAHYLTDVSGPRLTGSNGYARAANWAVATMKKWGLANAKTEVWGTFGKQWEIEDFSASMKSPYYESIRAYPMPWTPGTNGTQLADVMLIEPAKFRDTSYLKSHGADFKGKILLLTGGPIDFSSSFKPSAERYADTSLANLKDMYMVERSEIDTAIKYTKINQRIDQIMKDNGCVAMIFAGRGSVNGDVFVQANYGYNTKDPVTVPQLLIAREDGQKMKRLILSGQKVTLSLNMKVSWPNNAVKGYNVVAEIPGTDPTLKSQLVMLGGHLDSWQSATGATDNAAGCIVMMEAVRLLDSLGLKPKRTIRIALWDGEEQALFGSYNYAKNHFRADTTLAVKPEQKLVSAYFNLDNGTGKIRGIYAQNNEKVKPIFEQWLAPFHDLGATAVTMSNTGSTDHLSFDWAGIPAFQFVQDPMDYETRTHHSNLDDYDHLSIPDLQQAAIIVASFVYQTSVRPEMLPRKPLKKEIYAFDGL
jgi:carboxypeptidase Q